MNWKLIVAVTVLTLPAIGHADGHWGLESSTLTYHISHPLHQIDGISHAARGQGTCHEGQCDFLIAAPVKSFDSGDSNRDLHMLQVTRGGQYPIVTVRTRLPESSSASSAISADLDIQFAGQTVHYANVRLEQTGEGKLRRITGIVPSTVSDFKIDPPSLLAVPIKNEMPVKVEMTWRSE